MVKAIINRCLIKRAEALFTPTRTEEGEFLGVIEHGIYKGSYHFQFPNDNYVAVVFPSEVVQWINQPYCKYCYKGS